MMPNPHHQRLNDRSLVCYGVVVATASLLLLAILAATVSIVKACALAGTVLVLFSAAGYISRRCGADRVPGAPAALPTTATTMPAAGRPRAACGLVNAAIDALPAFAYARHAGAEGTGSSGKSGRCALCSVCLEDVEAGEMVRQLPACGHLFHVGCIDMWLHSHATCPLCRCDVLAQPVAAAADQRDGALPPA